MKKVEIETECGETTTVYVSQDIESIIVDGKKYNLKHEDEEDKRLPHEDSRINLKEFLEHILKVMKDSDNEHWNIDYNTTDDTMEIDWCGSRLPKAIFKL